MKYLVCSDSFKESMDANSACEIISKGIKRANKEAIIKQVPLADGGEGTEEVLIIAKKYSVKTIESFDLKGDKVVVKYGYKDNCVIFDCSKVIGIDFIKKSERNPMNYNSIGLGIVIKKLIKQGVKDFIIGLGGSGTVDGGLGMLVGLGAKLYKDNEEQKLNIESIKDLDKIDLTEVFKITQGVTISVASDVQNLYLGETGAVNVFARQKGATNDQMPKLNANLLNLHKIFKKYYGIDINVKKSGSAGGLGGAFFLIGAKLFSGIDMVINETNLEKLIIESDIVFSGEGSVDNQTANGKTISGVAKLCKKYNKKLIVVSGQLSNDIEDLYDMGVTVAFSIMKKNSSFEETLKNAEINLENTVYNICKLID
jgi:glycerate kinase